FKSCCSGPSVGSLRMKMRSFFSIVSRLSSEGLHELAYNITIAIQAVIDTTNPSPLRFASIYEEGILSSVSNPVAQTLPDLFLLKGSCWEVDSQPCQNVKT